MYDDLILKLRMKSDLEKLQGVKRPVEEQAMEAIQELINLHQMDMVQIVEQRRQIDFLMEA